MSRKLNMHVGVMFLMSLILSYVLVALVLNASASAYSMGFLIGRSLSATLLPLLLAAIPAWIYKKIKKQEMPGFYVLLWVLWVILGFLASVGSMLPA